MEIIEYLEGYAVCFLAVTQYFHYVINRAGNQLMSEIADALLYLNRKYIFIYLFFVSSSSNVFCAEYIFGKVNQFDSVPFP